MSTLASEPRQRMRMRLPQVNNLAKRPGTGFPASSGIDRIEALATCHPTSSDFWRRFPSAFSPSAMPERHRHHDSTERRKLFTITLESCSRSGGIRVHDAVETVITMSRNMQANTESSVITLRLDEGASCTIDSNDASVVICGNVTIPGYVLPISTIGGSSQCRHIVGISG